MPDLAQQITALARRAKTTDDLMNKSLTNATGVEQMSIDKMTDMYAVMSFEERYEMAISLLSEQGMDGLKTIKKIALRAQSRWGGA